MASMCPASGLFSRSCRIEAPYTCHRGVSGRTFGSVGPLRFPRTATRLESIAMVGRGEQPGSIVSRLDSVWKPIDYWRTHDSSQG